MNERRETDRLPRWAEDVLTPEQQRVVRRRFGLLHDSDAEIPVHLVDTDDGDGGGTPAPASPSAPASLRTARRRAGPNTRGR